MNNLSQKYKISFTGIQCNKVGTSFHPIPLHIYDPRYFYVCEKQNPTYVVTIRRKKGVV